jgi:hypothetical protein
METKNNLEGIHCRYLREEGIAFFKWEDDPFVVTVTATKTQRGYLTDWWISSPTWEGFHDEENPGFPKLMLRAQLGISKKESRIILEADLHTLWLENIKDLAFESAIQGGIEKNEIQTDSQIKSLHAEFHLEGHDRLGHFDSKKSVTPTTERSARQYGLLTSLGYPKAQQLIADYETEKLAIEVLVGAVDRRLYMSRKTGLIPKRDKDTQFFKNSNEWI